MVDVSGGHAMGTTYTDHQYPEPVVERWPFPLRLAIIASLSPPSWFLVYLLYACVGPVTFSMLCARVITQAISMLLERNESKLPPGYYRIYWS